MTMISVGALGLSAGSAPSADRLPLWVRSSDALDARNLLRLGIDELMALDDRMLAAIGLARGDVEHAAQRGRLAHPVPLPR